MGIRKHKPTTPGRRGSSVADFVEVTKSTPEKALLAPSPRKGGRNVHGRITTRHQGGGHKQRYRIIDFRRDKDGVPARVAAIEYDPNRTARIALLHYADGDKRYIVAPSRLRVGDTVESGEGADIKPGNACPSRTSRSAPSSTTWSCGRAAAPSSAAPPGRASSCWPRRAPWPPCGCRQARSARC